MSFWKKLFGGGDPPAARRRPIVEEAPPVDPDADYLLGLLQQSARSPHSDVASRVGDVAFFAAVDRLCARGQERLAADLLGRFVMLRPDHPPLLDRLAVLLERNADWAGAETFYRRLTAVPDAECRARLRLAELHLQRGEKREARDELELILARDVRFPGVQERVTALLDAQPSALATVAGPGDVMALGRYRLRGELGRGGSGIVYRAFDPALEREVAVKMLYQTHRATEEVELVARLRHPNLIGIYDFDLPSGVVVMELCSGGSLRTERLTSSELGAVLAQLADALAFLHEAAIVHGDLKPDNVLFRDGAAHEPVLSDFGLAQAGAATQARIGGTAGYIAPEVSELGQLGPAADVFSFGALLATCVAQLKDASAPLQARAAALIERLGARDPAARPATRALAGLVNELFRE